ncbi:DUF397 domain-containing protein [Streptomyces gilvosporeus]|uniref:DUF397 domain-containing protein n=1 Tax=Streptomyces gilvosporeus TaxID=553510 RepID=A0A1V0TRP9_9ACTN|nr:DUF397 domain-containing protein [Streptomyces gilvosporeus]ARF55626.1 DUF397 domain-containing protein [Streptomyces gilvosporeus]
MSQLTWQKSSFSTHQDTECVEVATGLDGTVHLRESDRPTDVLTMTPTRLRVLLECVKADGLD